MSNSKREKVAWALVFMQAFVLLFFVKEESSSPFPGRDVEWVEHGELVGTRRLDDNGDEHVVSLEMNKHPKEYYDRQNANAAVTKEAFYDAPKVYSPKEAGLVSRVWRSNGSPSIHSDLQTGSCWCSADDWCMCTPSLAIDVILRSGDNHIWCVRREDTGLLALMGGFTEVGETSEETVHRELQEEMGISLESPPILFGVYNDPRRDSRRHTTSVVYVADVPATAVPKAGDDATNVIRMPIEDVDKYKFFVDHQTIIHDYITMIERRKQQSNSSATKKENSVDEGAGDNKVTDILPEPRSGDREPFKRSVCPM